MTSRTFWWIAIAATVVKLWLTSFIAIDARLAPHDNGNFLEHAKFVLAGAWFGPYDDLTLIKGPATEVYLAAIRELGLPLPLAHQLLYLAACLAVCAAVAPIVRRGGALAIVFCALFFNPFTFSASAWILNRSQLTDSLALLCLAGAIGTLLRARSPIAAVMPWLGLLGGAVATLSLTREDTIWIAPPLLVFLAAYLWGLRASRVDRRGLRAALALVPVVCVVLADVTVAAINGAVYGWSTTVETTSPEFVSAYQSMSRLVVPGTDDNRTFPAPRAARTIAARVSPAAASLVPFFDRDGMWERTSCLTLHLCGDVSAGWFLWAFRDSVQGAGYYASGAKARAFYVSIGREIDAACDTGRIACRKKSYSLAPPMHLADLPAAMRFAGETFWHALSFDQVALGEPAGMTADDESVGPDYAAVALSTGSRVSTFRGWLLRPRDAGIRLDGRYATDFLSVDFEPSPDVEKRFARTPGFAADDTHRARFVMSTSCIHDCVLLIGTGPHATRIPLSAGVTSYRAPGIAYHLDFSSSDPIRYASGGFKAAALGLVLAIYQTIGPIAFATAVFLFALRSARVLRGKRGGIGARSLPVTAGITTAVAAHCATLGIVSAVSFYALFPEYEAALYPLVLLGCALEVTVEGPLFLRALRRSVRARRIARSIVAN